MMKNLLCVALLLFASLFASVSGASAAEIVLDPAHHHLGDNFKEELSPADPEGLVYTTTFTLDSSVDVGSAGLTMAVKSVVPGPTDEFLDKVYLNEIYIGALNDYIPEKTSDSAEVDIEISVHPTLFNQGTNTLKISAGSNAEGSNYDDFEFYDLTLHLDEIEPANLEPPLKVAWICELPLRLADEKPAWTTIFEDGVLYLREDYEMGFIAVDAKTGELLWSKDWRADLAYKDGVLFAVHSTNIDALDAKTGELLWSKEYPNTWWGTLVVFGNTLFVSTPNDRYVAAIDTENGDLKWKYEFNITDFGTEGRNYFDLSEPAVNGNLVVFRYHASHSIYTEPVAIPDDPELEPKLEKPLVKEGLIALDAKTGKEVWEYPDSGRSSSGPFLWKDLVYVGSGGNIIALSGKSGEEIWKTNVGGWADIVEVKHDKLLIDSSRPLILNAATGEIYKDFPDSGVPFSSCVITDDYIYSTDRYSIKVFDSGTGEPVWSSSKIKGFAISDPALYRDKLYLISTEGTLYAFEHGEGDMLLTEGLENSAAFYFPAVAIAAMLILLAILLSKIKNRALVFGSWLIALTGILYLSLRAIDPYIGGWGGLGLLAFLVFWSLPLILLIGIAFLVYGIRKRRKP